MFSLSARRPGKITSLAREGKVPICIVGLGYVGLRLAAYYASEGARVVGVDIDQEKVNSIKKGVCPINDSSLVERFEKAFKKKTLKATSHVPRGFSAYIISVSTPVNDQKQPVLSSVRHASESVSIALKRGSLVVLESTVYPGVTRNVVGPILEKGSGLNAGKEFGLAYCGERVDPGNVVHRPDNTPRIIGGINRKSCEHATALYRTFVTAEVIQVTSCETAEMVKLVENSYRDLNIAFVNELSVLSQRIGVDILEVLEAASTKWSFHTHFPGPGVGGSCIPVTPYYLLKAARDANFELTLSAQARRVNESMSGHTLKLVLEALNEIGMSASGSKIAILGVAYKGDIDDVRGSQGLIIGDALSKLGARVLFYDPHVPVDAVPGLSNNLGKAVKGADLILIMANHSSFRSLDLEQLRQKVKPRAALVDAVSTVSPASARKQGFVYKGLGRKKNSSLDFWQLIDRLSDDR